MGKYWKEQQSKSSQRKKLFNSTNLDRNRGTSTKVSENQCRSASNSAYLRKSANINLNLRKSANIHESRRRSANVSGSQRTSTSICEILRRSKNIDGNQRNIDENRCSFSAVFVQRSLVKSTCFSMLPCMALLIFQISKKTQKKH